MCLHNQNIGCLIVRKPLLFRLKGKVLSMVLFLATSPSAAKRGPIRLELNRRIAQLKMSWNSCVSTTSAPNEYVFARRISLLQRLDPTVFHDKLDLCIREPLNPERKTLMGNQLPLRLSWKSQVKGTIFL